MNPRWQYGMQLQDALLRVAPILSAKESVSGLRVLARTRSVYRATVALIKFVEGSGGPARYTISADDTRRGSEELGGAQGEGAGTHRALRYAGHHLAGHQCSAPGQFGREIRRSVRANRRHRNPRTLPS